MRQKFIFGWLVMVLIVTAPTSLATELGTGSAPLNASDIDYKSKYEARKNNEFELREREAIEKLSLAVEKTISADALLDYGSILEFGMGPAGLDRKGAYDFYEKAAGLGDKIAQSRMCVAYLLGQGRSLNRQKAYSDFCGKLPNTDGTYFFSTAYDYELGLSGPKDEKMALELYAQAFQKGSPEAMDALGRILLNKDKPKNAAAFLRQAVFNGSADAMDRLAAMLEAGQGVEADTDEAWWLYVNAARRGNEHARKRLTELPQRDLLPRSNLYEGKKTLITQTETGKGGPRTVPFSPQSAGEKVFANVSSGVLLGKVESRVDIHCYINKHNIVDVCLMQSEFPIGYGYGPSLMAVYSGKMAVAEQDLSGQRTAGTVFAVSHRWIFR